MQNRSEGELAVVVFVGCSDVDSLEPHLRRKHSIRPRPRCKEKATSVWVSNQRLPLVADAHLWNPTWALASSFTTTCHPHLFSGHITILENLCDISKKKIQGNIGFLLNSS